VSEAAAGLAITVSEVLGSSPVVAVGEEFVVRGDYVLEGAAVDHLVLSGLGRSGGQPAPLSPGAGAFEATAEILAVEAGKERLLDLVMIAKDGTDLGVHTRIRLEG
jgi:hypothetical protein